MNDFQIFSISTCILLCTSAFAVDIDKCRIKSNRPDIVNHLKLKNTLRAEDSHVFLKVESKDKGKEVDLSIFQNVDGKFIRIDQKKVKFRIFRNKQAWKKTLEVTATSLKDTCLKAKEITTVETTPERNGNYFLAITPEEAHATDKNKKDELMIRRAAEYCLNEHDMELASYSVNYSEKIRLNIYKDGILVTGKQYEKKEFNEREFNVGYFRHVRCEKKKDNIASNRVNDSGREFIKDKNFSSSPKSSAGAKASQE